MQKIKRIAIIISAIILIVPAAILGPYALRVQHFTANPAREYYADFYLYVSLQASRSGYAEVTLLVQPLSAPQKIGRYTPMPWTAIPSQLHAQILSGWIYNCWR